MQFFQRTVFDEQEEDTLVHPHLDWAHSATDTFRLPIQCAEECRAVPDSVSANVEWIDVIDAHNDEDIDRQAPPPTDVEEKDKDAKKDGEPKQTRKSVLHHLCSPSTEFAHCMLRRMAQHYTTNTAFLEDQQRWLQQSLASSKATGTATDAAAAAAAAAVAAVTLEEESEWMWMWRHLTAKDDAFREKYHYVEWDMASFLNESESFLAVNGWNTLLSPISALLTPLLLVLIPFGVLHARGIAVTFQEYFAVMRQLANSNALLKLMCADFNNLTWSDLFYMLVSAVLYLLSMYQNIVSCVRFYRNMREVQRCFRNAVALAQRTLARIEQWAAECTTLRLTTMQPFLLSLVPRQQRLEYLVAQLTPLLSDPAGHLWDLKPWLRIGACMRWFYLLHTDAQWHGLIADCFALHGYLDNMTTLRTKVLQHQLTPATFLHQKEADDGVAKGTEEKDTEQKDTEEEGTEVKDTKEKGGEEKGGEEKGGEEKGGEDNEESVVRMEGLVHPGMCGSNNDVAVAAAAATLVARNDVTLDRQIVLTGPNASGKTTLLKAVCLNLLLAQTVGVGCFARADIVPYHHFHSYMNVPDTGGRDSLFQAEARRCKAIAQSLQQHAHERHFCIFDELFSGTNPEEAELSASSFMTFLQQRPQVDAMLTTHFVSVCRNLAPLPRIRNMRMHSTADPISGKICHTYHVQEGVSEVKGGMAVLTDMAFPMEVLEAMQQHIAASTVSAKTNDSQLSTEAMQEAEKELDEVEEDEEDQEQKQGDDDRCRKRPRHDH